MLVRFSWKIVRQTSVTMVAPSMVMLSCVTLDFTVQEVRTEFNVQHLFTVHTLDKDRKILCLVLLIIIAPKEQQYQSVVLNSAPAHLRLRLSTAVNAQLDARW